MSYSVWCTPCTKEAIFRNGRFLATKEFSGLIFVSYLTQLVLAILNHLTWYALQPKPHPLMIIHVCRRQRLAMEWQRTVFLMSTCILNGIRLCRHEVVIFLWLCCFFVYVNNSPFCIGRHPALLSCDQSVIVVTPCDWSNLIGAPTFQRTESFVCPLTLPLSFSGRGWAETSCYSNLYFCYFTSNWHEMLWRLYRMFVPQIIFVHTFLWEHLPELMKAKIRLYHC